MHPFGKEEAASVEHLFGFFCECLKHGEWELAQACVPQLHRGQGDIPEKVERILQALVTCPDLMRCKQHNSPQRLAWIWLLILEKWLEWDRKFPPSTLRRRIEFLLLSEDLQNNIPEDILKELYEAIPQDDIGPLTDSIRKRENWAPQFSTKTVSILWDLLWQAPTQAQALLDLLLGEDNGIGAYGWPLQKLLIDFIQKALKSLKGLSPIPSKVADAIYGTLRILHCPGEPLGIEWHLLCGELLRACESEGGPLREEQLLGCLIRKTSWSLIAVYGNIYAEQVKEKTLGSKTLGKVPSEHLDPEKAMLTLFSNPNTTQSWKMAYFYCLSSHKHFLEQIVVTALVLLKEEDFSGLSCLLDREFRPLSQLLVLLGWTHCQSLESAKLLLQTLHRTEQNQESDKLLRDACDGLSAHVEILEWCLQQSSLSIRERDILHHLHSGGSHSVLYSLHHLTNLPALKEKDVLELLQKMLIKDPQQDQSDVSVSNHLNQCQNLTLFQGFCAMKYAIYALCVNSHQRSQCQVCKGVVSENLETNQEIIKESSSPGASNLFSTYLAKCQHYLCSVPNFLRLELLENIFSLLLITSSDLHPDPVLPEDYAEEDDLGGKSPPDLAWSPSENPQHVPQAERKPEGTVLEGLRDLPHTSSSCLIAEARAKNQEQSFLDLKHFTSGSSGFLADELAMEAFLKLLQEQLEEIHNSQPIEDLKLVENSSSSGSKDGLQNRLQQLSKVLSEAQWRYKVVISNQSTEEQLTASQKCHILATRHSSLRRTHRARKNKSDGRDRVSSLSLESTSSELSTSTSEGSLSTMSGRSELEVQLQPQPQNTLIPMMLSQPESLLASCILRGNFVEAHQVVFMFDLKSSPSCGELVFMECYQEVIQELAQVEHKIENTISDGVSTTVRRTSSGRSTLQAIGSAAAAGMVFYSISDVTDKLLGISRDPIPILQEDFWISNMHMEPTAPLRDILEDLSPPAMAAFDLACTQCQLWKTCKQLLETAERRLHSSFESRGRKLDYVLLNSEGIRGFPVVLQQIGKLLNYPFVPVGQIKSDNAEEKAGSHPRYSIRDLLQMCLPSLTEDCVSNQVTLYQQREQILQTLIQALQLPEPKGNLLSSLVAQASQKLPEIGAHPVQIQTHLLMKNLNSQILGDSGTIDYVGAFFTYSSTMASVVLRSLSSEPDHAVKVKVGNPFIILHQSPSQLMSHLLLERQIPPDRLASLLSQEQLSLSVPQIIISCCCEPFPLCPSRQSQQTWSLLTHLGVLAQLHTSCYLKDIPLPSLGLTEPKEKPLLDLPSPSFSGDSPTPALTASALAFLKSHSKLLTILACLGATQGSQVSKPSLSWKELCGRREAPLAPEQVARECEILLNEVPMLETFLTAAWEPLRGTCEEEQSLAGGLCGHTCLSAVLLGLHSPVAMDVLTKAFEEALVARDWTRALQLMDLYGQDMEELSSIRDVVLSCATVNDKDGWHYLFSVKDAVLRSKMALWLVERWPLEPCLEILAFCISEPAIPEELVSELHTKLNELQVYQKILDLQSTPLWPDWQTLKRCCADNPPMVMDLILEAKEYELCEKWGNLYPIPREHLISLNQKHLLYLLDSGDHEKALQLLQRISDPIMRLDVTERSLDQHPGLAASHFLANYLTTHFYRELTATRHYEIQALYVGSKVLLTLPESHRASYSHLSSSPLLMLEQLLMNMKVDWATVALQTLHHLLAGQEIGFTMEDIDALLSRYAGKALDFPYSLKEKRSDSVIHPQEIFNQVSEPETLSRSTSVELSAAAFPGVSFVRSSSLKERSFPHSDPLEFVPPEKPPARQHWVPDEMEITCMVCRSEHFTMFNRRHHCRRCGRLVCGSCSTKKMDVEGSRENPARVCDQCYSHYNKHLPEDSMGHSEASESISTESPPYLAVVRVPKAAQLEWTLDLNEEENNLVRSEFYYEQAPSASLCIAILNLHRDPIACGHQLIDHCCRLSRGLTNPEVDAGLLTDIMKQLLFSAKMMFVRAGQSQDLALCDSYISKVDVLNILVSAAYRHVPSLDQILHPAAVTRLRNQLLEAEYYQLGVEVSTKTGLDLTGAWHAWGMACLKAGNLTAAREKFSRCLKPPLDLNQLTHGSRLVQDVIEYLESTAKPILSVDDDYFATLKELEATLRTKSLSLEMIPEGKSMHNTYYQECLFYLHHYSTHLAIISFYMRHNCMREALQHLQKKESPPEVFIEGIFQPSYTSGKLHILENLLEDIDPTLESWGKYLIAACQHLQKKNYYHLLYELQQFMKDQVRAAMTCIRFFCHKAKTYAELGEKLTWLLKAKDHLKIYLQEASRSTGKKKLTFFRKKMNSADVSRHMNTVGLQLEVTRFLHRCESAGTSQITALPLPTLFGNNHMKMDVACKVMLGGKNVEDGFGIAFRVLQDFKLDAPATYCKVAQQLVKREKYSEIRQLLKCVNESGVAAKSDGDTILLSCLEKFGSIPSQELDGLIQAIHSDDNKVLAYLMCSKLRSAYLIAVKQEYSRAMDLVQQVQNAAQSSGDKVVQEICAQWLLNSRTRCPHGFSSRK
ncbi:zinc finger FYVE domain-containing protein 26 isoform X3 [Sminthopsis crassicaudata]|uniref:zinc finger FYVE domain-containing protein 26 isoform X3 n=1 Tax=Sminthopsis crassicaudata TaxID=9301 RepID=UPI003D688285